VLEAFILGNCEDCPGGSAPVNLSRNLRIRVSMSPAAAGAMAHADCSVGLFRVIEPGGMRQFGSEP
jgi:hypothetical protein